MPCFNRRAREERDAYIRAHQKHVNLFENLSNPLEIIKVFHAVRVHDPLIIYTPYDGRISECYRALRADDTAALLDHAVGLYQANRQKEAKKIATCLLLFQSVDLSPLLDLMITQKDLEPAFLFAGAPVSLQQKLHEHFLEDPRPEMDAFQCLTWLFRANLPHKLEVLPEVKSLIDTYRRPAFAVVPRQQTGADSTPTQSFLGGVTLGAPGETWPTHEDVPLNPVLQLCMNDLPFIPEALQRITYLCVFIHPDDLGPVFDEEGGLVIRAYTDNALAPLAVPESIQNNTAPLSFRVFDDYPDGFENSRPYDFLQEISSPYVNDGAPVYDWRADFQHQSFYTPMPNECRILGWPRWIQDDERSDESEFILQVADGDLWNYGELSALYLFRRKTPDAFWGNLQIA